MPSTNNNETQIHYQRLKWSCRRGMLELDILLSKFLEANYMQLTPADVQAFQELLSATDTELYNWVLGRELVNDPYLHNLIMKIQQHAVASY